MDAMTAVPYLLIIWIMGQNVQQQEYSSQAACENARQILLHSAVGKDGKTRRDLNAMCVTEYIID